MIFPQFVALNEAKLDNYDRFLRDTTNKIKQSDDNYSDKMKAIKSEIEILKKGYLMLEYNTTWTIIILLRLDLKIEKETLDEFRQNDHEKFEEFQKDLIESLGNIKLSSKNEKGSSNNDPAMNERIIKLEYNIVTLLEISNKIIGLLGICSFKIRIFL